MAYSCAEKKKTKATGTAKLMTANVYDGPQVGLSPPLLHVEIDAVGEGIKWDHVKTGNQTWVRISLTLEMIRVMKESIGK